MGALNEKSTGHDRADISASGSRGRELSLNLGFSVRWFWAALVVLCSVWIIHGFFQPLAEDVMEHSATPKEMQFTTRIELTPARLARTPRSFGAYLLARRGMT